MAALGRPYSFRIDTRMYLICIDNFSQSTTPYMLKEEPYKEYLSKVLAIFNEVYRVQANRNFIHKA